MNELVKHNNLGLYISFCLIALALGVIFSDGLLYMTKSWEREEYSHGYMIPLISFWFVWKNREYISQFNGNWFGLVIVLFGIMIGFMGELATLFVVTQYAFLVILYGLCLALLGWKGMHLLWFALVYLFFMIPLPNFLYNNLSSNLQLISSQLGVAVIRLFDISVYLQGNVIDLGSYQLQVVEACSGLRYLFPLTSFGFLCAYFFRAPLWMRSLVFLTTLPITVLMNSFRIGVIGVLVEYWGIEQAEGFLHDFEGWIIFIGCLGILFAEMWLFMRVFMSEKNFSKVFVVDVTVPGGYQINSEQENQERNSDEPKSRLILPWSYIGACTLLLLMIPMALLVSEREDRIPQRKEFKVFPLHVDNWRGTEVGMEQQYIDTLKFDDYIIANYSLPGDRAPVNFYVAYYASQRKGVSAHSPKSCIPGDGWQIGDFTQRKIDEVKTQTGEQLIVNRAVISKGKSRQLVYYWFQQRGRIITNEYLVKWYLFWDALTLGRTDGAMVRLVVALPPGSEEAEADAKLASFLQSFFAEVEGYVPN